MRLTSKLFKLARKARDIEVITSGSPKKMGRRVINKAIGRKVVRKLRMG